MATNPRIDDLRKRLEKEPNSRLFAQLAEELRKDGEFEEAIRIARAGLARHPAYPSARMTLGRALFDTGDMASARQELQSVLEGAPDNILASRLLAECLESLGDLEGALKRYRATLALSPGDKPLTARVRELEGKLQSAARPGASAANAAAAVPIKLATVDEPMVLETSHERHAAPAERPAAPPAPPQAPPAGSAPAPPAPIKVVDSAPDFELENAYEAPGTQWRVPAGEATAPIAAFEAPPPPADASTPTPPERLMASTFEEIPAGERTLVDEPAPTVAMEATDVKPFEYAFETAGPSGGPEPVKEAPAPMPPLPDPVTAAPRVAATAVEPAAEDRPVPPLPPVVAPVDDPAAARAAEHGASPAPSPPAAPVSPPAPAAAEGELVSPTLAELYFNQGFPEKAIEVYRRLLEREPSNERARARVTELQAAAAHPPAPPAPAAGGSEAEQARAARRQALERTIERLETLRAALQKGAR